ncbi:hypothetical protein A3709_19450 [Halioglobus sp. HI00S01]|nr:hypothetical protein A3709_19450 [Halioglobus sp. HI00S01]
MSRSRTKRHKSLFTVKVLSGPQAGQTYLKKTAEDARAECFYLADVLNTCATWYPPLFEE